jgi:isopenicillin N synthase-like dioxygenase
MLPIIDLTPLLSGDGRDGSGVTDEIAMACEKTGFFYARNHGVSQATIDAAFAASRQFFALPLPTKKTFCRERGRYRGYIVPSPFSEDQTSGKAFLYEAFIVGAEVHPEDPQIIASEGLYSPNIWPTHPRGFKSAVSAYWDAVTALSYHLLRAFSLALGASEDFLVTQFNKPLSNISLLHYPARPDDLGDGELDARAHFDTDAVTVLLPGEVGGLQVQHREGEWMDVDPLPGCFVINIGNMLEAWSGGRFRSTMHRVHPPVGLERYSIAYFAHPDYDTLVKPLPDLPATRATGKPVEIHAGKDLAAFVATFDGS